MIHWLVVSSGSLSIDCKLVDFQCVPCIELYWSFMYIRLFECVTNIALVSSRLSGLFSPSEATNIEKEIYVLSIRIVDLLDNVCCALGWHSRSHCFQHHWCHLGHDSVNMFLRYEFAIIERYVSRITFWYLIAMSGLCEYVLRYKFLI